ncbi:MAG: transcriptional regulator [Oceanospirillales bacterium LUC14_002_19_P2]|nr:MAG: transcriptional regulator [Oceanospirillales bacterium LUC14_002_19_P2]
MSDVIEISMQDMRSNAQKASTLLKALANENRLMILCLLVEGEMNVAEINAQIDLSQSALSQHLAVLRRDGLVATRRESQTIYYRIASQEAGKILETLHGIYCVSGGR